MVEFENFFSFLQKSHRLILWSIVVLLFILDIITTTIGLKKGGLEQNQFMVPFVDNPILHLIIKFVGFIIFFAIIESGFIFIKRIPLDEKFSWNNLGYFVGYTLCIIALIWLIWLFLNININNILFIIPQS